MASKLAAVALLLMVCICAAYGLWCINVGLHGKSKRHLIEGFLLWLAAGALCWLLIARFG